MTMRFAKLLALLGVLFLHLADARAGILNAFYNSATDVPAAPAGGYDANGGIVNFTLNFAPPVGTNLTVVKITNPLFQVNGTFANLAQNQAVTLDYGGVPYNFVANYFGGTGNDLVLQWAGSRAMAWGNNGSGQLGNNTTTTSGLPVAVTSSGVLAGKTVVALSAGRSHSLALCSDGTVAAWGVNASGQIGSNGGAQSNVPVIVSGLGALATRRVVAIAAGEIHSLALCSDGRVAAWGFNGNGRLGNGTTTGTATPVLVTSAAGGIAGQKVVAIAAGQGHSMALLADGKVVTWGEDFYGQLGNGAAGGSTVPVLVDTAGLPLGKTATAIAAGDNHCLALCSDGTIAAWGNNKDGQIGDGSTTQRNSPVSVNIGTAIAPTHIYGRTVTSIAAGALYSLALCSDGTVSAWGAGTLGQLGNGGSASSSLPVPVDATGALLGKIVASIAGGSTHSLALCSDGTLTAWGANGFGQTGTGSTSSMPMIVSTTPLLGGERFTVAASGPSALHTLAIVAFPAPPGSLTAGTLISNGSFESGFANWSVSDINPGSYYVPLQRRDNNFNPGYGLFSTAATNGSYSASSGFGGNVPGIVRLAHDVTVTAAEPFVRFDYRAGWDLLGYSPTYPARTFAVTIEPAGGGTVLRRTVILSAVSGTRNLDTGPLTGAVDLSAFIGTTLRVCFDLTVQEPSGGPAFFQLDNVRTAAPLPATVHPITGSATGITLGGATLNGISNANGAVATVQFEYGATTSYGSVINTVPTHANGNTDTPVSATLAGLDGKTTYHYRVKTVRGGVVDYGADATFTPLPHEPGISGLGLSGLTSSSAIFYAGVNTDESSTVVTFEYGLTADCTSSTPAWESPSTNFNGGAHAQISGLKGGTTYYCRIRAQNAGGVTVSDPPLTFTTPPAQPGDPTVNTLAPTMVDRYGARLNGSVKAGGPALHERQAFLLPVMRNVTNAGGEILGMMYTADNFATVSDFALGDLASAPGQGLRDPCLLRVNGTWYCFCTLDAWGIGSPNPNQNKFRILTSTNLTTWTTLADVTVPGATQLTWAPKAFYDAPSNRIYVTISSDRTPAVGAHDPKLASASLNDLTTWSGWTTVSSLLPSPSSVFWDFQLSTDGVHYYAIGVTSGAAPSMKIYRSDTIDSGYTLFSTFDFGGGQFAEQCWLEFLGGTNWEIYYCKPQLGKIYRRTSADGMGTWSAEELIHDYTSSGKSFACPFRLPPEMTPSSAVSATSVSVSFEFGTTTQYTSGVGAFPSTVNGSVDTPVSGNRYGLSPGTTYHYRARAFGPNGYVYGPDVTFTTPAIGFPAASTDRALNITQTTAVLSGFASANNGPQTTVGFEYGTDTNYGSTVTLPGFAPGNSLAFMQTQIPVSGDGITFHYRIRATNNIGTTYGQDMTFTTPFVNEARLYDLALNGGSLFPVFDRDLTSYAMSLPFETPNFSLAPTASTGIASVTINGVSVPSGSNSDPIALNVGSNVITIIVTALDGVTQRTYTITVTRAAPVAGSLDLSFNGTGIRTDNLGASYDYAYATVIQGDGKIVVAGGSYNGNEYDFAVARYNPDGTPDMNFGTEGKVTTDFAAWGDIASSVALQSDGKIVVAGSAGNGVSGDFAVARYNADGTPDTTFNGTGKVITVFPSGGASASSVAVQSDGKIVVAGYAQNGTDNDFALARYHGDISTGAPGTLDTAFNGTGKILTPLGGDDFISCMKLQANGKIVVAGYANIGGILKSALARYEVNGTLDTSFNGTGTVVMNLGTTEDAINTVTLQSDGKIVTAGHSNNGSNYDFAVARFHGDIATGMAGTLDTTFNGTGKVITAIGSSDDVPTALAVQGDGKIVVAGYSKFDAFRTDFAVVRYKGDGSLDTTFHGAGKTTNDLALGNAYAMAMTLQGDGKIVAAGYVSSGFFDDFALVRYLGDGPAIAVQAAPGPNVFDGISTVQFPGALPGASTSLTFTIQNTGTANLTGLGITIDGADNSAFMVTSNPTAPVSPFGTTTFTVRFLPTTLGPKTAALHIASNVTGHTQSYDIALTGTGLTPLQNWRQSHFPTFNNSGDAADAADPNGNGISNLVEYALKGDPTGNTTGTGILPQASTAPSSFFGDRLQLGFTRYADRTDITLIVQGADSPAGPWSDLATNVNAGGWNIAPGAVVTQLIIPFVDPVAFIVTVFDPYLVTDPDHPARFMRLKVTSP